MSSQEDAWNWFNDNPEAGTGAGDFDRKLLAKTASRFFATPEGAYLLKYLRAITLERTLGPNATDQALRHLEGQRQLVDMIVRLSDHKA